MCAAASITHGRVPRLFSPHVRAPKCAPVRMGAVGAGADVLASVTEELALAHASVLTSLVETLDMAPVDFAARYGCETITGADVSGSVQSFEAPQSKVAWCSSLTLLGDKGGDRDFSARSIQVWNAPAISVPHYHALVGTSSGGINLSIDFRPRLNAGYERQAPDGSFPEPLSREEFAQAGVRAAYDANFFDADARRWHAALRATVGAELVPPREVNVEGRRQFGGSAGVSYGPLRLELRLPLTEAAAAVAASAVEESAARWLRWMAAASEAAWMANRMMYDRDCQVRHAVYRTQAAELEGVCGVELALRVAAANAGRQDMVGHNTLGLGMGHGYDDSDGRD